MPPVEDGKARVVMKITGVLVNLLVDIAPEIYGPHVVYEKGHKVLYVQVVLVFQLVKCLLHESNLELVGCHCACLLVVVAVGPPVGFSFVGSS